MTINTWDISSEFIRLDAFSKLTGAVPTGGQAKHSIQEGTVEVNGAVCLQRGKKLRPGDTVRLAGGETLYRVGPVPAGGTC